MDIKGSMVTGTPGGSKMEPHDDMEFDSNDAAYEFYKEYAKSVGFGTAKLSSRRSRASKEFIDAKFSCIRYGNKQQSEDAVNPRPSPKIGCKASMHVKRKQNGKWYIYSFVKEHNHELLPSQAHFFRSHRDADPFTTDAKLRRKKVLASVSKQYGAYQYNDSEYFVQNFHDVGRQLILEEGDAQVLLELFVNMQDENPKFFYAVDLNERHHLRSMFWADAKGIDDYGNFGEVVSLDTTYFSKKYKIPLVFFVGVNQHMHPTLFGCALIADETTYTYLWLLQTFVLAMGGRAPNVILSDQKDSIEGAITHAFPNTRHMYCLWHVLEKIPRQLDYLTPWLEVFMPKFNDCVSGSWTEEQFERRWWTLVDEFKLREDRWLQSLFLCRFKWAPIFMKNISLAGLSTLSRSESPNTFFDKYVQVDTSLRDFVEQYKVVLEDRYEEQAKADFDAWHETPELKSPSPFEKQLSFAYSHEIFKKFQFEVLGAAACHFKKEREHESSIALVVKDIENNQDFMVEWSEVKSEICCSCRSFELKGYLCRHAILVLQMSGVFTIPFKYVLQRWTSAARSKYPISERFDQVQTKTRRFNDLCRRAIIVGEEGSLSQESYIIALNAIKEALLQCSNKNNFIENELTAETSLPLALHRTEEENPADAVVSKKQVSGQIANKTNKGSKRAESGKGKTSSVDAANKKGKVPAEPVIVSIGIDASLCHMEPPDVRPMQLHNVMPLSPHLHNVVPTMFPNVASTQFHNVSSARLQDTHLPD